MSYYCLLLLDSTIEDLHNSKRFFDKVSSIITAYNPNELFGSADIRVIESLQIL